MELLLFCSYHFSIGFHIAISRRGVVLKGGAM